MTIETMTEETVMETITSRVDDAQGALRYAHLLLCASAERYGELLKIADLDVEGSAYIIDCLSDGVAWVQSVVSELERGVHVPGVVDVLSLRRAGESLAVASDLLHVFNGELLAACG
jgi:hypothetical protein